MKGNFVGQKYGCTCEKRKIGCVIIVRQTCVKEVFALKILPGKGFRKTLHQTTAQNDYKTDDECGGVNPQAFSTEVFLRNKTKKQRYQQHGQFYLQIHQSVCRIAAPKHAYAVENIKQNQPKQRIARIEHQFDRVFAAEQFTACQQCQSQKHYRKAFEERGQGYTKATKNQCRENQSLCKGCEFAHVELLNGNGIS